MKKHKQLLAIIFIFLSILTIKITIVNSRYYKLKELYLNPIKTNQEYNSYIYDEYTNHICILFYEGEEKEVTVPSKINEKPVYSIDDSAFYGNEVLEKITIPDSIIRIGHQAFIGNNNLKIVDLPDNVIDIGPYSFDVCPNLKKIYVKKGSKTEKVLKKTKFKKYITNK